MAAEDNLSKGQFNQPTLPGMSSVKKEDSTYRRFHKGYQLDYSNEVTRPNSSRPYLSHKITTTFRGKQVGHVEWFEHVPEVGDIQVHPKHQRKGIATAMYNMAASLPTKSPIEHSDSRTPEGEAWSQNTHNYYPRQYGIVSYNNYAPKKKA
jgi:GNAT superfamily N-acetyltransferase